MNKLTSKSAFVLLCLFISIQAVLSQCPKQDVEFNTQQDLIDFSIAFPDCTELGVALKLNSVNKGGISDLSALSNITEIASLEINGEEISSFENLGPLEISGDFVVRDYDGEISDLGELDILGRYQIINSTLKTLEGIKLKEGLEIIILQVEDANNLKDLKGCENIFEVFSLKISNNDLLESLQGLENVRVRGATLELINNPLLSDCSAICNTLGGDLYYFDAFGNGSGCNSYQEIRDNCSSGCPPVIGGYISITLSSQQEIIDYVEEYPNCAIWGHKLILNNQSEGDITDLSPLSHIISLRGLEIRGENIPTFEGFGPLRIRDEFEVRNYNGEINGLGKLEILQEIRIVNSSISTLENLSLRANTELETLYIGNADNLIDLKGLENVIRVANLAIVGNEKIQSLQGLENIQEVSENFSISNNMSLSDCSDICIISSSDFYYSNIGENISGCNSIDEIINSCTFLMNVDCPEDTVIQQAAYNAITIVDYDTLGVEVLNCDSGENLSIELLEGIASGEEFPIGVTSNIISVAADCEGEEALMQTCSFDVTVEQFPTCPEEELVISTQADVENFLSTYPECTELQASLVISSNDSSLDLSELSKIKKINGSLVLLNLGDVSLAGIGPLETTRGLILDSLDANASLVGLGELDINGLDMFRCSIPTLDGLILKEDSRFEDIFIIGNHNLLNLSGLDGVTSVSDVCIISDNNGLTSLTGLENINSVGTFLRVSGNPDLVDCTGICGAIRPSTTEANFGNNAPNSIECNSLSDLKEACITPPCDTCATCPNGGYSFSNQDAIDNFFITYPNCSTINGDVSFSASSSDFINWEIISYLDTINGDVTIRDEISNAYGMENLVINGDLDVRNIRFDGDLDGFSNITLNGSLNVFFNTGSDLGGMSFNPNSNVDNIGVAQNDGSRNLNMLSGINSVNNIINIQNNSDLNNIFALESIQSAQVFILTDNENLINCVGACNLIRNVDDVTIESNGFGVDENSMCFSVGIVESQCPDPTLTCPPGDVVINGQLEADNFKLLYPNCTEINGDLEIISSSNGPPVNFNGLENIQSIAGTLTLRIRGSAEFENVGPWIVNDGMIVRSFNDSAEIEDLGEITLNGTFSAFDIDAEYLGLDFSSESNIESIRIRDNDGLEDVPDFSNISFLDGDIIIEDNENLESIRGLRNIQSITGLIEIVENSDLDDCSPICTLLSSTDDVTFFENDFPGESEPFNGPWCDFDRLTSYCADISLAIDIVCPEDIFETVDAGSSDKEIFYQQPQVESSCSESEEISLEQTAGLESGSLFPIGTTTNTFELTVTCGEQISSTSCSFDVVVTENITELAVFITCPESFSQNVDVNSSTALVTFPSPILDSNCEAEENFVVTQTSGLASGSQYPVGITTNTFEVTLTCGEETITETCSFDVLVTNIDGGVTPSPSDCPSEIAGFTFVGIYDNTKFFLSENKMNWAEANVIAMELESDLASFENQGQLDYIRSVLNEQAIIGLNDKENEGDFDWVNSSENTFVPDILTNSESLDYGQINPWAASIELISVSVEKKVLLSASCGTGLTIVCPEDIEVEVPSALTSKVVNYDEVMLSQNCNPNATVDLNLLSGLSSGAAFPIGNTIVEYKAILPCGEETLNQTCSFNVALTSLDINCTQDLPGYDFLGEFEGHQYFISQAKMDWSSASDIAVGNSSYLVSINSQAENEFLQSQIDETVFIGLFYDAANNLSWASGDQYDYESNLLYPNMTQRYGAINFWDGSWEMLHFNTEKKHIIELPCTNDPVSAELVCEEDQILYAPFGETEIQLTWDAPSLISNCPGTSTIITQTTGPEVGAIFSIGESASITYALADECGNSEECTFQILVSEKENECQEVLPGFEYLGDFGNSEYYISNQKLNWIEADYDALRNYGQLATISTSEENEFIRSKISNFVFIGYNDFENEGVLSWSSNEESDFENISICPWCNENDEENDFAVMNFWNGGWSFVSAVVEKRYILERTCNSNQDLSQFLNEFNTIERIDVRSNGYSENQNFNIDVAPYLELYPNPAVDVLFFDSILLLERIKIFNTNGQLMKSKSISSNKGLDISSLANGVYWVKAISDEKIFTKKLIVKR